MQNQNQSESSQLLGLLYRKSLENDLLVQEVQRLRQQVAALTAQPTPEEAARGDQPA